MRFDVRFRKITFLPAAIRRRDAEPPPEQRAERTEAFETHRQTNLRHRQTALREQSLGLEA